MGILEKVKQSLLGKATQAEANSSLQQQVQEKTITISANTGIEKMNRKKTLTSLSKNITDVKKKGTSNRKYHKRVAKEELDNAVKAAEKRLKYLKKRQAIAKGKPVAKRKPSTRKYAPQDRDYHFYRFWAKDKGLIELGKAWERKRKNMVYYSQIFVDFQNRMIATFNKHGSEEEKDFVTSLIVNQPEYKIFQ